MEVEVGRAVNVQAGAGLPWIVRGVFNPVEAGEQIGERDVGFHAGQRRAEAEVDAR